MAPDAEVRPDFKICGLTSPADAVSAAALGARYVGAILVRDSPRLVDIQGARSISDAVDIPLAIVVADWTAEQVASAARTAGAGVVQLHGNEDEDLVGALRTEGAWEVWKVVRPRSADELVEAASRFAGIVDLLLVDAWHPERLGGTGSRADWSEIARVRDRIPASLRFGLAGGLDPENVADAIQIVHPDLVDVASGVEAVPGRKDPDLLEAFARRVRRGVTGAGSSDKIDRED